MRMLNRREMIAGLSATTALAQTPAAFADPSQAKPTPTHGAWTPATDLPYPVQEIYPTAHKLLEATAGSRKPITRSLLVNAGGFTPSTDFDFNISDDLTIYDPISNEWRYGPRLVRPTHHLSLVSNSGKLYAIGGFTGGPSGRWQMLSDVNVLSDLDNGYWERSAPLPSPQAECVAVSLAGRIHVVGGRGPSGSLNDKWTDHIDTDRHWTYIASQDRWVERSPLPEARNSSAGAVFSNALYVIGGRRVNGGNSNRVDVYEPLSDRWQDAAPLPKSKTKQAPVGQGGLAAATYNQKIYAFGGEWFAGADTNGGVYSDVWEYDPREDKWRSVAAMTRPRHGLGAVTMADGIYVIGGATEPGGHGTSAAVDRFEI